MIAANSSNLSNSRQQLNRNKFTRGLSPFGLAAFPSRAGWPRDNEGEPPPASKVDPNDPVVKQIVDAAVAEATKGLKANRDDIMNKYQESKKILDSLGGEGGLAALVELQKKIDNDELLQLLKAGKHDEYFERRAKPIKDQHEAIVKAKDEQIAALTTERDKSVGDLHTYMFKAEVTEACKASEVLASAYGDVERALRDEFKFDPETKKFVRYDENGKPVFGKEGKAHQTPAERLAERQKDSRHWWGASKSGNSKGNEQVGGQNGEVDLSKLSDAEYEKARREGAGGGKSSYL